MSIDKAELLEMLKAAYTEGFQAGYTSLVIDLEPLKLLPATGFKNQGQVLGAGLRAFEHSICRYQQCSKEHDSRQRVLL